MLAALGLKKKSNFLSQDCLDLIKFGIDFSIKISIIRSDLRVLRSDHSDQILKIKNKIKLDLILSTLFGNLIILR